MIGRGRFLRKMWGTEQPQFAAIDPAFPQFRVIEPHSTKTRTFHALPLSALSHAIPVPLLSTRLEKQQQTIDGDRLSPRLICPHAERIIQQMHKWPAIATLAVLFVICTAGCAVTGRSATAESSLLPGNAVDPVDEKIQVALIQFYAWLRGTHQLLVIPTPPVPRRTQPVLPTPTGDQIKSRLEKLLKDPTIRAILESGGPAT